VDLAAEVAVHSDECVHPEQRGSSAPAAFVTVTHAFTSTCGETLLDECKVHKGDAEA
jgi:hypothetical protein